MISDHYDVASRIDSNPITFWPKIKIKISILARFLKFLLALNSTNLTFKMKYNY